MKVYRCRFCCAVTVEEPERCSRCGLSAFTVVEMEEPPRAEQEKPRRKVKPDADV
jgi:hypothetical protein